MRLPISRIFLAAALAISGISATETAQAVTEVSEVAEVNPPPPVLPPPDMDLKAAATVETSPATAEASESPGTRLEQVLAGDWRSAANVARDRYRHPRETLGFFAVDANQKVLEIWPGGGWYAEILAPLLRSSGSYTAVLPTPASAGEGAPNTQRNNDALRKKFADRPDLFDQAKVIEVDSAAPVLGEANSADVVLTFRNVHNWVMDGNEKAMFQAFFAVLRPGGTLGVVDHRAAADQPAALMKTSGYLPEATVIALATQAGFELVAKSEINANSRDTRDYPDGVWTLPPRLIKGEQDRARYLAIGESDRMTLRFRKPLR